MDGIIYFVTRGLQHAGHCPDLEIADSALRLMPLSASDLASAQPPLVSSMHLCICLSVGTCITSTSSRTMVGDTIIIMTITVAGVETGVQSSPLSTRRALVTTLKAALGSSG